MVTSIEEMQWVLRAQCHDREALEQLLRTDSISPEITVMTKRILRAIELASRK